MMPVRLIEKTSTLFYIFLEKVNVAAPGVDAGALPG
jgi:hypothetical protein